MTHSRNTFDDFIDIIKKLRSEKGCPWDKKQSPQSLKPYLVEETNELLEAIDADDHQHIKEELGDILYVVILLSEIYSEKHLFTIDEVLEAISAKMIRRHPHVFNDEKIESSAALRQKWLEIKAGEKAHRPATKKN